MCAESPSLQQWLEAGVARWCQDLGPGESRWLPGCLPRALSYLGTFSWKPLLWAEPG